mmetsp:Transcript_18406/g.40949  ORF Transcript_18406/g.40949 Transcript_18406/m.40949 type:complete len:244 (-) Transcript_18406:835-1566(-)
MRQHLLLHSQQRTRGGQHAQVLPLHVTQLEEQLLRDRGLVQGQQRPVRDPVLEAQRGAYVAETCQQDALLHLAVGVVSPSRLEGGGVHPGVVRVCGEHGEDQAQRIPGQQALAFSALVCAGVLGLGLGGSLALVVGDLRQVQEELARGRRQLRHLVGGQLGGHADLVGDHDVEAVVVVEAAQDEPGHLVLVGDEVELDEAHEPLERHAVALHAPRVLQRDLPLQRHQLVCVDEVVEAAQLGVC